MSIEKLTDEKLADIAGGMTAELKAAYACIRGDFGNGAARVASLRKAGLDPEVVQGLVNSILAELSRRQQKIIKIEEASGGDKYPFQ